jgi:hypothetical protein
MLPDQREILIVKFALQHGKQRAESLGCEVPGMQVSDGPELL